MPKLKDPKIYKIYYTTNEVAKIIGVSHREITRRDEMYGISPKRNNRNARKYSVSQVNKHVRIEHLVTVEKFTHEGAKRQIELNGWEHQKVEV